MIIGSDVFKPEVIKKFVHNPEDIVAYSDSVIPLWARHIPNIKNNQRYFFAVKVRGMLTLTYKQRKSLIDRLIDGVQISGSMRQFISIDNIIAACDRDALIVLTKEAINEKANS